MDYVLKIESFEGEHVSVHVENGKQNNIYCVISLDENGAEIVDSGYRSEQEARAAWPEAG